MFVFFNNRNTTMEFLPNSIFLPLPVENISFCDTYYLPSCPGYLLHVCCLFQNIFYLTLAVLVVLPQSKFVSFLSKLLTSCFLPFSKYFLPYPVLISCPVKILTYIGFQPVGILTYCILVDSSTVISWTSPFVILGVSGLFCHFYSIFDGNVSIQCRP